MVRPGRSSRSLMIDRVKGTVGDRMPLDELPLSDEQIALLQRWIDQGARATPTSAPAPAPWEAPLALQAPALPAVVWSAWSRPADRLVASYLAKSRVPQPTLVVGCDVRQARLPGHLGPAAAGRRPSRVRRRHRARQARSAGRQAAGGRQEIRRALDFLLERSAAQRGRPDVFLRAERTEEHHRVADGIARRQQAVRPVRGEAAQPGATGRSRGVPHRRQLAGRDERGGDAVDAGVAEHRAGVSRRQLQVQRVSRQLREQVEAEGRVRPRGVFLARAEAAAVSLRHRARRVRTAVVLLSRARAARAFFVAERSARDRRGDLHRSAQRPHAADGRQSDLDQAPRPRHRRRTRTRWTGSRGVRRCSTGWPATSSRTSTTSSI